ncbi:hypothetical protein SAMN05421663_104173 [Terribacillus halophilus]|uniref:Uncharacterized protein n=1 Tax=Terribacillus halophilus TaxID=361279 RepID=A0A1G6PLV0_9BACI|nr:hypothetical protein [Terribacillus halophilus]SDC80931.1 hypothetical protein SAMN05421663_104173 [Terribacillus halophilus]
MSIVGATIILIVIVGFIFLLMWYAMKSEKKMKSQEVQENHTPSRVTEKVEYIEGNPIATLLMVVGVVTMVVGIVIGFISSIPDSYLDEFKIVPLLIWSFAGISSGAIFVGLSEIIKLIDRIRINLLDGSVKDKAVKLGG